MPRIPSSGVVLLYDAMLQLWRDLPKALLMRAVAVHRVSRQAIEQSRHRCSKFKDGWMPDG